MTTEANPTLMRGACPHDCPDTCATLTEVRDGKAVRFYADKSHPITQGWLCAKVRPYLERVYATDRLRHPLRRVGPKGGDNWERISWEAALDLIAKRFAAIAATHGAEALLPHRYLGSMGVVQMRSPMRASRPSITSTRTRRGPARRAGRRS